MVSVENASPGDAPRFAALEQATDTAEFILPYPADEHARKMADPGFVYLRILNAGELVGFFILVPDPDPRSIEFRRVVVSTKDRGIGQSAITAMEQFCRTELKATRTWLDVFEHNHRARHVYEKLGYDRYGEREHEGRTLLLYQKEL